ncbi:MAG: tRNA (5-methylaminomethyl-2-thiouridine)(34)-methyltransferase MnmD [Cytophagales bacterium]|nr:tRNA (5-methylaminomethyl-2-thiouridine)(34)-methyltransferase MnmD [Cytophagales bacterium]
MPEVKLITTEDGSHSLYVPELNETYHSFHGAVNESQHIYLDKGLAIWEEQNPKKNARILEIGFGTGLNALLTIKHALTTQKAVNYTTLEAYPLPPDITDSLNYCEQLADERLPSYFKKMHAEKWDVAFELDPLMAMKKIHGKLEDATFEKDAYDLVYFDAFAPNKQSEMWTLEALEKAAKAMAPGACLVTYCARGQFKRDLKALGLEVETLDGPPGKKEMVRAVKPKQA